MQSTRTIYFAVATLVLTMGVGTYVDIANDAMHARHLEINTGLERMVRLNQELASMLVVSVLERNTLRTASYDTVNADLETTIKSVGLLTKQQNLSEEISALSEDHRALHVTEEAALKLMRQDRWPEARQLLFADSYVLAKKIYEINSETAVGALTGELASTAQRFDQLRQAVHGLRIVALLVLLWAGVMFSRRLRAEVAMQARLREQIAAANLALEEKVQTRTAELEAANRQLEALSATDGLTGLANRNLLNDRITQAVAWAKRQELTVGVMLLDLDHFKLINDGSGHGAGDEMLRQVAQRP